MLSRLQASIEHWLQRPQLSQAIFRGEGFALGTQKGHVRDSNQDRVALVRASFRRASSEDFVLGVLCDGMGGMHHGERCAELAVASFITGVLGSNSSELGLAMAEAAEFANDDIYEEFLGAGGTTLSAIAICRSGITAVNIGDSRSYTIRANGILSQESRDDTLSSQLAAIGEASKDAKSDLLQYIGMGPDLIPNIYRINLSLSDPISGVLLTSDGAHSIPGLAEIARHAGTPRELLERILATSLWVGGRDNASSIAISLKALNSGSNQRFGYLEITGPFGAVELPTEWIADLPRRFRPKPYRDESAISFEPSFDNGKNRHLSFEKSLTDSAMPQKERRRKLRSNPKSSPKDKVLKDNPSSSLIIDLDPRPSSIDQSLEVQRRTSTPPTKRKK